jgi:hypothetical protein
MNNETKKLVQTLRQLAFLRLAHAVNLHGDRIMPPSDPRTHRKSMMLNRGTAKA